MSKVLYDTKWYGEPKLQAFTPEHVPRYYRSCNEIYKSFDEAKAQVEKEILSNLQYWQSELEVLRALDENSVPMVEDPYV